MTTEDSLKNRTIGEIAATLPGATAVFRKFKLDYCCGGDVALAEAVRKHGLDIATIEAALAALDLSKPAPAPEATDALIEHILNRYHATHRRELPELIRLARKVEAVHAGNPEVPHGLADTLEVMQTDLEEHMQEEETELFPLMRQHDNAVSTHPIAQMRHDHDRYGEHLRHLETICRSWGALYAGTAKLVEDLMQHIHLENNVLFPRFEHRVAA
jgi:regulator of cell morphogenesis and NO signaling